MQFLVSHWEWIASSFLAVFMAPFFVLFTLMMYAARSERPFDILKAADMPAARKQQALEYLRGVQSRVATVGVCAIDASAPYVTLIALLFTKWEDEKLPKLFKWWDNEISINGDKSDWALDENGKQYRLPLPLEDTPRVREFCYYAKGHHGRSFYARWIWLGWRNRASKYAFDRGPEATPELLADVEYWGDPLTNNGHEGVLVRRMGPHFEVYAAQRKGSKCYRTRYGCKIGNVILFGAARAMLTGNGVSIQKWKG